MSRFSAGWGRLMDWLLYDKRASYGLAVMRIGYGAMTIVTLILYAPQVSYTFGRGSLWGSALTTTSSASTLPWPLGAIFDRSDDDLLLVVKYVLLLALAAAYMLGWRTRVVGPVFTVAWLSFSTLNPVITNTGHYQTFRVMLIFLLFADVSRRWSLDARRRSRKAAVSPPRVSWWGHVPPWWGALLNNGAVLLIGAQLCVIYVTSALWKLQGWMWLDGVAVYYPLRLQELRPFPWLSDLLWQVPPLVYVASWVSLFVQLLMPLMLLHRWTRVAALLCLTAMHVGIGIVLALPFFSGVMLFADAIFIRERSWDAVRRLVWPWWLGVRARAGRVPRRRSRHEEVSPELAA